LLSQLVWLRRLENGMQRGFRAFDIAGSHVRSINYGAVYFLIKVLGMKEWESSRVFPIYSVGVVAISSLLAAVLFEERLSWLKTLGLVVGLAAVVVLNQ
jgi:multidrug transporter EmrE-like cation transporter